MSDLLIEVQHLRKDSNKRLDKLENGMEKMEKQQANTNLALSELRLSVMTLTDSIADFADHEKKN